MRSVVFSTASIGYWFYIDSDGTFGYSKTTDGGATWGAQVEISSATTHVAFDVWFDQWTPSDSGTLIHTWYFDSTNDIVRWRTLDTSGDTLGTQRACFTGASAVAGRGAFCSGTKTRSGYLYVAFDIDAGAERGLVRSTDSGTTWSSNLSTTFVNASGDQCLMFPATGTGDNNDVVSIMHVAASDVFQLRGWDSSAGTLFNSVTLGLIDNTTDLTGQMGFSASVRHSDGAIIIAWVNDRDTVTSDFWAASITANSTATKTDFTNIAANKDDIYYPQIFIDQNTDAIYIAFQGTLDGLENLGTATKTYYIKSTDGGTTWSAGNTYQEGATSANFQTWCPISGPRFYVGWRVGTTLVGNAVNSVNVVPSGPTTYPVALTATFTPTATVRKLTSQGGFVATLSLAGNFAKGLLYLRNFAATLFGDPNFPVTNLVSYWKLDEAGIGTRYDSFGTNHLTGNNNTGYATGIISNAASFNPGLGNFLYCASNSSLEMSGNTSFTISCWVRLAALPFTGNGFSLVTKDDDAANSRDFTLDYFETVGSGLRFYINGGATYITGAVSASINTWYFIVAWYDSGDGSLHIRVNNTSQADSITGATGVVVSAAQFRIGAREYAGFEDYANAVIDEVGIWKRVLTPTEITYLYNGGAGRTYSSPVSATLARKPNKALTATLSSAAAISRRIIDAGFTATLSFVGSVIKTARKRFTATVFNPVADSYTTAGVSDILGTEEGQTFTSAVSGPLSRVTFQLYRVGNPVNNIVARLYNITGTSGIDGVPSGVAIATSNIVAGSTLPTVSQDQVFTFSGSNQVTLTKGQSYAITVDAGAVVDPDHVFISFDETDVTHAGNFVYFAGTWQFDTFPDIPFSVYVSVGNLTMTKLLIRALTATLSFVGLLVKKPNKELSGTLSFVGALRSRTNKTFTAVLSFVGTLTRNISKRLVATLSFVGNLATSFIQGAQVFLQALTGTLSFVGAISRSPKKSLTASLTPVGVLSKKMFRSLTAVLTFVGALAKRTSRSFAATLSFVGLLTLVKLLVRTFTAALSFTGLLVRRPNKALSATLSFVGLLRNRVGKAFSAVLSFVGQLNRQTRKKLTAVLSFVGSLGTQLNAGAQTFFQTFSALLTPVGNLATSYSHLGVLFFKAFTATLSFVGAFARSLSFLREFVATLRFNIGAGVGYYSSFTINSGQVPSTQTDFPILVNVVDARFKTVANGGRVEDSNGYDIRPYSDVGLTLPLSYELERYNASTGEVIMSIKRSSVSDGLVTYLKYGDPTITTDGSSSSTWSNGYLGVYHLGNGTTINVNSATGTNNGTNNGVTAVVGQVDGAGSFVSSSSQYVALPASIGPLTYSAWIKATSFPAAQNSIVVKNGSGVQGLAIFWVTSAGKVYGQFGNNAVTGATTLSTATWYHVATVFDGIQPVDVYVNGALDAHAAGVGSGTNLGSNLTQIGSDQSVGSRYFNGAIDEVRISSSARSANWLLTEYRNQFAPSVFMTLGAEVGVGAATDPLTLKVFKGLTGALSFVGNLARSFIGGVHVFFQEFTALLEFNLIAAASTDPLSMKTFKRLIATLSFVGNLSTGAIHVFFQNFVATLTFNGRLRRQMGASLLATLNFTGRLTRRTNKFLYATLNFFGLLVRGLVSDWQYYIDLRPGAFDPTESTLRTTVTESNLTYISTESTLEHTESESELTYTEAESSNFRNVVTNDNS